jgi:hypothetical protein
MAFYVDLILTWMLFLALFPISGFWLYRAYRIAIKKDYSVVALKGGIPAPNPRKFIIPDVILHTVAAALLLFTIYGVIVAAWPYNTWTALAGSTIWCKIMFSFVMGRHAHPKIKMRPKKA